MNSGLVRWVLSFVLTIFFLQSSAFARDYIIRVDGEDIRMDLDRSRVAVGFTAQTGLTEREQLINSLQALGSPAIAASDERMNVNFLNLKPNLTEEQVLEAMSMLESSTASEWAAPVLMYDGLMHVPLKKLFVKFDSFTDSGTRIETLEKYGLTQIEESGSSLDDVMTAVRPKGNGTESLDICLELSEEPGILWAEPDFIRTVYAHTNDTYYSQQWYLHNTGQSYAYGTPDADIDAPEAWTYTTGSSSIVISICDVGVEIDHPDLDGHIETGYDAYDGDSDPNPETSNDGHGTCCAGIAAAETNNSTGVAGVGYNCHLMGTKLGYIIGGNSIYTTNTWIVNCINYSRDHADVMSNSWGGGTPSSTVNDALTSAKAAGLTILFSSGNYETSVQWPATRTAVIAVGATNQDDERCTPDDWGSGQGSNYGPELDVVAPGNDQRTTDLTGSWGYNGSGDYYAYFGGTSGACPVAAGVCGLILSVDPSLTPSLVQTILQTTADDQVGDPSEDGPGFDNYMGWGRVNANNAVRYVFGAPSNLQATSGQTDVPLDWDPPWRTPSEYDVYRSDTQYGTYVLQHTTSSSYWNDPNVTGGETYWYKVKAVYTYGESEFSNTASAVPASSFPPPENLIAGDGNDGNVPVSWNEPEGGTPDSYDLYRSEDGEFGTYNFLINVGGLVHVDYDVINGNVYWYKAKALYSDPTGESEFSNADMGWPMAAPNTPPTLLHDPLPDFAVGSGTVVAVASDEETMRTILSVKMFYRQDGAGPFDSLALMPTGNPEEYSANLAFLESSDYQYYLRAIDNGDSVVYLPEDAPSEVYSFDVDELCPDELAYDDGSAETYSYCGDAAGQHFLWAVKFGPVETPYILCGARFAAARTIPDEVHMPIYVAVYLADGAGGEPGTLVWEDTTGSVGNVVGGLPAGTNWAEVVIKGDLGEMLAINETEFYIALGNTHASMLEAYGRDTGGTLAHRSYHYDPCEDTWYNEDDTGLTENALPGNRLIRARGYSLLPPSNVVVNLNGSGEIQLWWEDTGAPQYAIYSSATSDGPFTTWEGNTSETTWIDDTIVDPDGMLFYQVVAEVP